VPEYKQQWQVSSSDGERAYTVSVTFDDVWSCSCVGWTRHMPRHDCKHVKGKKVQFQSSSQSPRKTTEHSEGASGWPVDSAPTAASAVKAGASKEEAADVARVKREEVQAKKDAKLGKIRFGFQLAHKYEPSDLNIGKWVAEVKYDGELGMLIDGRIINRSGRDVTHRFPEIGVIGDAVLVGEIVILDESGFSCFNKIQERNTDDLLKIQMAARTSPATFVAFDMLEDSSGRNLTGLPLSERRVAMEIYFQGPGTFLGRRGVKLSEQIPIENDTDVQILVNRCRELGTEGIMLKNMGSAYVAKRGRNWVKAKTWQETELPVLRYEDTGVGDGFVIYVQLTTGREQRVVVNGFRDREALKSGLAAGKVMAEIKFLSASKEDGALRFPSFRRLVEVAGRRLIP